MHLERCRAGLEIEGNPAGDCVDEALGECVREHRRLVGLLRHQRLQREDLHTREAFLMPLGVKQSEKRSLKVSC